MHIIIYIYIYIIYILHAQVFEPSCMQTHLFYLYHLQSTFGASLEEIDDLVRGYYISLILHKNLLVFLTLVSYIRIR